MTQEEIIRMAREAGGFRGELPKGDAWMFFEDAYIERFAALVATHEREACAKVCEAEADATDAHLHMCIDALRDCADAIRARGQA